MFNNGQTLTPITLSGIGGWNQALHPADIADTELSIAYNCWFEASTGTLETRGGLTIADANQLSNPITVMKSFIRTPSEGWIVCVSGSELFYLSSGTWVSLGAVESETPTMQVFNSKLYIADGSTLGLLSWDGTTVQRVTGSPTATAVFTIAERLVCNSVDELDATYFSVIKDGDDFDTQNGAQIVRAGFGDGQQVNGFSAISKTLIISKMSYAEDGATDKTFYGVDTSLTPESWEGFYISHNNACVGAHAIQGHQQDVLYIDSQGIESLTPTQKYGDIATDPTIGGKVNGFVLSAIKGYSGEVKVLSLPTLASIWFILGRYVLSFSSLTNAFTLLEFRTVINYAITHGDETYLAGESGYLYKLSTSGYDEIEPDDMIDFGSVFALKMISGSGDLYLQKSHYDIQYITDGTYEIRCSSGEQPETRLLQSVDFVGGSGGGYLFDANEDLADATYELGSVGTNQRIPCRGKFRGDGILLRIGTKNGGRISIGKVTAMVAQIGR